MKVIIAGGRDYIAHRKHVVALSKLLINIGASTIISGGCVSGADLVGELVGSALSIDVEIFYADWQRYGKAAGPIRNEQMAKQAKGCILLPGGRGTRNMKNIARKHGLKIWKIQ